MALDTAAERASASGYGKPWQQSVVPDGSIGQGDRQTGCSAYSGILAASSLPGVPFPVQLMGRKTSPLLRMGNVR